MRGWKTIQTVATDEAKAVRDIVAGSIQAEIKRRGLD
jgi:ribosomal protein S17E